MLVKELFLYGNETGLALNKKMQDKKECMSNYCSLENRQREVLKGHGNEGTQVEGIWEQRTKEPVNINNYIGDTSKISRCKVKAFSQWGSDMSNNNNKSRSPALLEK